MNFNFLLLIFELLALNSLLLAIHRLSPRYGIISIVGISAALVGMMRFASAISVYVTVTPDLRITYASGLFIPTILLVVLVLYVVEGIIPARAAIVTIIGVDLLSFLVFSSLWLHTLIPGGGLRADREVTALLVNPSLRTVLASSVAFGIDLIGIGILFQALVNHLPRLPLWAKSGLTLTVILAINNVVFWALASESVDEFVAFTPGSVLSSLISALLLTPVLAVYLGHIAPRLPHFRGLERRPTFALLFGSYGQIERRLTRAETALRDLMAKYIAEVDDERTRANRLRDFINELVHDMRNPLAGINLRIQILGRTGDNPEQRQRQLEAVQLQLKHLSTMVDTVVDIVRLEQAPHSREGTDLGEFLSEVFAATHVNGEAKGLLMTLTLPEQALTVPMDRVTLARAVINLMDNAIRYTETGTVALAGYRDGDCAAITVTDTGIGIAPDEVAHIYKRHFRSPQAARETNEGLGLGLAIVKRVVEEHNGSISVTSQKTPSSGTRFIITLPCA